MTVSINGHNVTFKSDTEVLRWVHNNGFIIEPTKNGIRCVDANNRIIFEY